MIDSSGVVRAVGSLLVAVCACSSCDKDGSSSASSSGAAPIADVEGSCRADCAWAMRCGKNSPAQGDGGPPCTAECMRRLGAFVDGFRADYVKSLTSCYDTLDCGRNDDSCTATALRAAGDDLDADLHGPDVLACRAKYDACSGAFTDDVCGFLAVLVDGKRAELARCFDGPCADVKACIGL